MTWRILSSSFQSMLPNWSLKALTMLHSRSSSGSGLATAAAVGTGPISASCVRQGDLHRGPLLDAVAVHVDGFEDALGQIVFLRVRAASGSGS